MYITYKRHYHIYCYCLQKEIKFFMSADLDHSLPIACGEQEFAEERNHF